MSQHWLNRERLTNYPRIFLALYALGALALFASSHGGLDPFHKPNGHDFITFWAASRLALSGNPAAAYDVATIVRVEWAVVPGFHTFNPWLYPPTFLLVVLPLSLLPYLLSYAVFMAATGIAYVLVIRRIFAPPGSLPLLLAFPGMFVNILEGQNGFLTAALAGGALLLLESRPVWAGILIGLLTIKPQLGLLFPLALVCGRHWRALIAAALTAALLLGLSVAVLGIDTLPAFQAAVSRFPAWVIQEGGLFVKISSFFAFARLLGAPVAIAYAVHGTIAAMVVLIVAWVWLRSRDNDLRCCTLLAGSLLATPYVLNYDLAWLALPIAWFSRYALRVGWLPGEREILAALWVLPLAMAPLAEYTRVQMAPPLLLLFLLLVLRRVRAATAPLATLRSTVP